MNNLTFKQQKIILTILIFISIGIFFTGVLNSIYWLAIIAIVVIIPLFVILNNVEKEEKEEENKISIENNNDIHINVNITSNDKSKICKFYKPPEGYEIVDWTFTNTKVRGCQYCIDEDTDICSGDDVEIIHEPTKKFPENTNIYINYEKVGVLKQEMAEEWYLKYGDNYKFYGTVLEFENDEEYPFLLIEIKKPILKKIK